MRNLLAALLIALAALAPHAPAAAAERSWTFADALAAEIMVDVRLAPDGSVALVDAFHSDLSKNAFDDAYQFVRIADGTTAPAPAELSQPRWSPDGRAIAWLRTGKDGVAQLVVTNASGAAQRALTRGPRSIVTFSWSPDGKRLAAEETSGASNAAPGRMHWMTAESDYRNTLPPKRELYLIDAATGSQQLLTHDSWSYGGPETDHDPSWAQSGNTVALVRQPTPVYGDFEHAQYVTVNTHDGSVAQIVDHPFFAYPGTIAPMYAPTGDAVAYAHTWDGALPSREDVFVGGRDVTASLDRDLWSCGGSSAQWQPNALIVSLMDGASLRLYRVDPSGAAPPQALTPAEGSVAAFSAAPSGRIAYAWSTPSSTSQLYVLDPGGTPRQVTHVPTPRNLPVATTKYFEWKAPDGRTMHGQLTLPASASLATAPLVVELHGGPQCADDVSFSGYAQILASNGYAFFRPDPRGSDGYGDWSYKAVVGNWGEGPAGDVTTGIDAVLASGVGNAGNIYLQGGSYGGYLTTWIVSHDRRFKAAVADVPVTNLLLEYTLSESPNIMRRFFGDKPAADAALLARESPITYAPAVRTPLLILIGLRDTRAPYHQAIEFYKTVAENGGETRLLADDLAGHGPDDPAGTVMWWQAGMAWFAQHGAPQIPGVEMPK